MSIADILRGSGDMETRIGSILDRNTELEKELQILAGRNHYVEMINEIYKLQVDSGFTTEEAIANVSEARSLDSDYVTTMYSKR